MFTSDRPPRRRRVQRVRLGATATVELVAIDHEGTATLGVEDDKASSPSRRSRRSPTPARTSRHTTGGRGSTSQAPTAMRAPGQGSGQLRDGVRARRAVLRRWASTRSSCGCATTPRSIRSRAAVVEQGAAGLLPRRRRTIRLGDGATRRVGSMRDGNWLVGYGMAGVTFGSGQAPCQARSRSDADGTAPCAARRPTSAPAPTRSRRSSRPSCSASRSAR